MNAYLFCPNLKIKWLDSTIDTFTYIEKDRRIEKMSKEKKSDVNSSFNIENYQNAQELAKNEKSIFQNLLVFLLISIRLFYKKEETTSS